MHEELKNPITIKFPIIIFFFNVDKLHLLQKKTRTEKKQPIFCHSLQCTM